MVLMNSRSSEVEKLTQQLLERDHEVELLQRKLELVEAQEREKQLHSETRR